MSEPFVGQIMQVGFNFAPTNWALCTGQLISLSQNQALFALIGTTFGGDGRTNFGLPDLQGRVAVGTGTGAGLPTYNWGQKAGNYQVTLLQTNLPAHNHTATVTVAASTAGGTTSNAATGSLLGTVSDPSAGGQPLIYVPAGTAGATVNLGGTSATTGLTGSNVPVQIEPPYLALTTIIALYGVYPTRS